MWVKETYRRKNCKNLVREGTRRYASRRLCDFADDLPRVPYNLGVPAIDHTGKRRGTTGKKVFRNGRIMRRQKYTQEVRNPVITWAVFPCNHGSRIPERGEFEF
jgi:hypothetical protein